MNLHRKEDQAGLFGTILFHALLLFLLMISFTMCQKELPEDPLDGAVSVSIGEPDYGGPDQSTSPVPQPQPNPQEQQVDEQVTSDVEGAPEVQSNPNPTPSIPNPQTTPTPDPPQRTVDENSLFKPGSGSGSGDGDKTGNQGQADGQPDGQPDGTGTGTQGVGDSGNGWSGGISGFAVARPHTPVNERQEFGKVTIVVCVDREGNIISAKKGGSPQTATSTYLDQLSVQAAKRFKFVRTGNATSKNCGYITFEYKRG